MASAKNKYQNYSAELKQYINPFKEQRQRNMGGFWEMMGVMKQMFIDRVSRGPSSIPQVKPDVMEFLRPSSHLKFIWFGHSTLLFNLDGKIILVDPVFSDYAFSLDIFVKRFQAPALSLSELPHIDLILISHDHYDHLDEKTIKHFVDKKTRFLTPTGVGDELVEWGVSRERITELGWDESTTEFGIKFTATPAQHFSGRSLFSKNQTLWASWVIQSQNDKIFYSGDSGYAEHFRAIGEQYGPFDITFIENGQYNERWLDVHMLPEETIQAHIDLKGKVFVPVHWGMFALALHPWTEPVERTYALAKEKGIPYLSPLLGQTVLLGDKIQTTAWWRSELNTQPNPVLSVTTPVQEK
ncbi:MBL fold metallo-hydrolase [Bdellovibrio sp. 22V]|uniref:MBL fold metallo-hydrolase n=1 Tax=Bdellovibrio TaxID=958 RepID=UPI002542C555|nr:MBL fold metallo-hydrolase [Bdellovibrio sp. 22V]WII71052.1 MBL fold metallo-hydrolase [Bdellovibrio sp. 22V]